MIALEMKTVYENIADPDTAGELETDVTPLTSREISHRLPFLFFEVTFVRPDEFAARLCVAVHLQWLLPPLFTSVNIS